MMLESFKRRLFIYLSTKESCLACEGDGILLCVQVVQCKLYSASWHHNPASQRFPLNVSLVDVYDRTYCRRREHVHTPSAD